MEQTENQDRPFSFHAKLISGIFHPAVLPVLIILYYYLKFPPFNRSVLLLCGITLVLLPLAGSLLYFRSKGLKNMFVIEREYRMVPFYINIACILLTLPLLKFTTPRQAVYNLLLIYLLLTFVAFSITFFWKISLHSIGVAGILGFMIGIGAPMGMLWLPWLAALAAGLVVWGRLYLKAHTKAEVIAGLLLGFAGVFLMTKLAVVDY